MIPPGADPVNLAAVFPDALLAKESPNDDPIITTCTSPPKKHTGLKSQPAHNNQIRDPKAPLDFSQDPLMSAALDNDPLHPALDSSATDSMLDSLLNGLDHQDFDFAQGNDFHHHPISPLSHPSNHALSPQHFKPFAEDPISLLKSDFYFDDCVPSANQAYSLTHEAAALVDYTTEASAVGNAASGTPHVDYTTSIKYSPSSPSVSSSSSPQTSSDKHDDLPPIVKQEPALDQVPHPSIITPASTTSLSSIGSSSDYKKPTAKHKHTQPSHPAKDYPAPNYMQDFNPDDWADLDKSNLKYNIHISDSPIKSRVETQIKIALHFYPPPSESIVHLPADTISKPKLQLRDPFYPIPTALSLDTIVICDTDHNHYVNMCRCCLNRERKRAFRKKTRLPVEEAHWSLDKEKRAIVFNCKEIVDFGSLVDVDIDGKTVTAKKLELPIRMACYCRHHNEKVGFRALFVVRDYTGNVVARGSTSSIMITDDHKAASSRATGASAGIKRLNSEIDAAEDDDFVMTTASSTAANSSHQAISATSSPSPKNDYQISDYGPRKKKTTALPSQPPPSSASLPLSATPQSLVSSSSKRGSHSTPANTNIRSKRQSSSAATAVSAANVAAAAASAARSIRSYSTSSCAVASPPSTSFSNVSSPSYLLKSPISPPNPSSSPSATFDGIINPFYGNGTPAAASAATRPTSTIASPVASPSDLTAVPSSHSVLTQTNAVPSPQPEDSLSSSLNAFIQSQSSAAVSGLPDIQKIIPQTGPIRGGIDVSLFGFNFIDGLVPKFGENKSVLTTCWSDRSMVTQLPPSRTPGPVIVSFDGLAAMPRSQIFSYYDDTDRQLIELALRVVGVKMNGKLEDARDIARRIVGPGTGFDSEMQSFCGSGSNTAGGNSEATESLGIPPHRLEILLLKLMALMDSYNNDARPNWQLRNNEGQTMLHLSAILGLERFVQMLLLRGAHVDIQDKNGYTPLHFSALHDNRSIVSMLLSHNADGTLCTYLGQTYHDLVDIETQGSQVWPDNERLPKSQEMFAFNEESSEEEYQGDVEDDEDEDSDESGDFFFSSHINYHHPLSQHQFAFLGDDTDTSEDGDDEFHESDFNEDEEKPQVPAGSATLAHKLGWYIPSFLRTPEELAIHKRAAYSVASPEKPSTSQHDPQQPFNAMAYHYNNAITTGSAYLRGMFGRGGAVDETPGSSPPDYYDLFPHGSGSNPDYTNSAIDEEKPADAAFVAATTEGEPSSANRSSTVEEVVTTTTTTVETRQPTEDEVVEIWRNNRKKLQNDRMFLFFWLPVFIFTLVWVCYRMVAYMDYVDGEALGDGLGPADASVAAASTAAAAAGRAAGVATLRAGLDAGMTRAAVLRTWMHDSVASVAKRVLGFGKYQRRVVYDAVAASASALNAQNPWAPVAQTARGPGVVS